ncbi:RICIN domain-containing protein [Xylanibacillus composti]|uniref:Ricin B lectin domain-containing protein n=1 Tax=Xylanibacillus composti TaxID=1572762 RepID=A0A8J4GZN3_9BACL|nr:RICIN domain-containing protein [Xylanibacillus composti]GIQ68177.1 hypothetical protein XYCOK13_10010 [Xylanibacillus composti]
MITAAAIKRWHIVAHNDGTYKLISQHSGKALDVTDHGTANGTNVPNLERQWASGPEVDIDQAVRLCQV